MNEIVDFPGRKSGDSRTDPLTELIARHPHQSPAYLEFCLGRQSMVRGFAGWLNASPPPEELQDEIVTTTKLLTLLIELAVPVPPDAA